MKGGGDMKKVFIVLVFGIVFAYLRSVYNPSVPMKKHELRGVFVATVYNLDFKQHESEEAYQQAYLELLDTCEAFHLNTIIFQIRPSNDAFYDSKIHPWSRYLTGEEGKDPGFDPLTFMIEETHKRGMEFHAWVNPYRVTTKSITNDYSKEEVLKELAPSNYARLNPQLTISDQNGYLLYNPGEPQVKEMIQRTIDEIITHYDVDAIHFDDYFYPSNGLKQNEDINTYLQYKRNNESIDDFRRRNVDEMIQSISELIKNHNQQKNKHIQFGISPFGIWRNKQTDPLGSYTTGNQSYDTMYADTKKWVEQEWVDYISPQIYWEIGYKKANYERLVDWWSEVVRQTNVNLYISQGLYRYESGFDDYEVPNQLKINRSNEVVKGNIFYSYRFLTKNDRVSLVVGLNRIQSVYYQTVALHPVSNDHQIKPAPIQNVTHVTSSQTGIQISWDMVQNAKYYVIYRFEEGNEVDLTNPKHIHSIVSKCNPELIDTTINSDQHYTYYITVVGYNGVESDPIEVQYNLNEIDEQPSNQSQSYAFVYLFISVFSFGFVFAFVYFRRKSQT